MNMGDFLQMAPFKEKLKKKYGTIHQHNLQLLMIEIFKTKNNLNPTFMKKIFTKRNIPDSLRSENHLRLPKVKTTTHGIENVQYREVAICGPHYRGKLKIPTHSLNSNEK